LTLADWGNGYSRSFSMGFVTTSIGVIALVLLSIENSKREPILVKSDDVLD
jgi:hypothetical protein